MDVQTIATSSLIASMVAFALNQGVRWQLDSRKARALLRGMELEIARAEDVAKAYLQNSQGKPWAPITPITSDFLGPGLVTLAELGALRQQEIREIRLLYIYALESNTSLELLTQHLKDFRMRDDSQGGPPIVSASRGLTHESLRARGKLEGVLNAIPAARAAIAAALKRLEWFERPE